MSGLLLHILLIGALSFFPRIAFPQPVSFDEAVESPEFWAKNRFCLARVTRLLPETEVEDQRIELELVKSFGEPPPQQTHIISIFAMRFPNSRHSPAKNPVFEQGSRGGLARPALAAGDILVVILGEQGTILPDVVKIEDPPEHNSLVATLTDISAVRASTPPPYALTQGLKNPRDAVVMYCLQALATRADLKGIEKIAELVQSVRDDETRSGRVRLFANLVMEKAKSDVPDPSKRVAWLKSAIKDSQKASAETISQFVDALTQVESGRDQFGAFALPLVSNARQRAEVRAPLIVALTHPRFFRYEADDPWSNHVFDTIASVVSDENPRVRQVATAYASRLARHTTADGIRENRVKRITRIILDRMNLEKNPEVKQVLQMQLAELERMVAP